MSLDLDEVRKIGRLARLSLGDSADETAMARDLSAIVDYFDQLSDYEADPEPDTRAVDPAAERTAERSSREAEDRVGECLDRSLFEANAPEARNGFLVVPRITAGSAKA